MPALRIGEHVELSLHPEAFQNEYELQEILANHPSLLVKQDDAPVFTVCRELSLEDGFVDIFLIDKEGVPIIVEVKLSRNPESRRVVIGQLFDYISAIARLKPEELDRRVGNCLDEKFLSAARSEADEEKIKAKKSLIESNFATYLREGKIRGILVLDEVPDDLIREFSYINEHSILDLRLLAIERYRLSRDEHFYHSRFLVSGKADAKTQSRPRYMLVVEKYSKMMAPEFMTHKTGKANVRVKVEGWPPGVHYEFCDWKDSISIEILVRINDHPIIADFLPQLQEHLQSIIPRTQRVEMIQELFGWKRLQFFFDETTDPFWIADAMARLIKNSRKDIEILLKRES